MSGEVLWDVFRCNPKEGPSHWVGMARGNDEQEALADITLEASRGPYKVIRWYGRKDPRNCHTSGGQEEDPK